MYNQSAKNLQARAFPRIARNLDYGKNVILYDSFILSNIYYCPLIRMFSRKSSNDEINRLYKRAMRVLLDDYGSTFEEVLQKRDEHTTHTRNLQQLPLEVYKCLTWSAASFPWDLFECKPIQMPNTRTF